MHVYTAETTPEIIEKQKYISVRCPHIGIDGYICGRLLAKVYDGYGTEVIKCPKCKSFIRVSVIK